jgi:hypothetical protein
VFKNGRGQSKLFIGRKFEKNIKELEPREACVYFGTEGSHYIEQKIDKEKLKNEYLRGLKLVFGTELSEKNKIQPI